MENYVRELKIRRTLYAVLLVVVTAVILITSRAFIDRLGQAEDVGSAVSFISGFRVGLFIVVIGSIVNFLYNYHRAINNDDKLKALYIEETDERKVFIRTKIGHNGFNIIMMGVSVATIIAGSFDQVIFFTLLGVLIFIALTKGFLKVYYNRKF